MIKAIVRELLAWYFIAKANSYTRYFIWPATILGVGLLGAANFLYFFDNNREIGLYLIIGTIAIGSALILYLISVLIGKKMAYSALGKIESAPETLADLALKQMSGFISKRNRGFIASAIIPIGLIALTLYKKRRRK